MTYAIPEGSTLQHPVYQCCGETFLQAPQAMYHLWRHHEKIAKTAWDAVVHLRTAAECRTAQDVMDREQEERHDAE